MSLRSLSLLTSSHFLNFSCNKYHSFFISLLPLFFSSSPLSFSLPFSFVFQTKTMHGSCALSKWRHIKCKISPPCFSLPLSSLLPPFLSFFVSLSLCFSLPFFPSCFTPFLYLSLLSFSLPSFSLFLYLLFLYLPLLTPSFPRAFFSFELN